MSDKLKAKPEIIQMLAKRDKCWMCKHSFQSMKIGTGCVLLPVPEDKIQRGKFQPQINPYVTWHMKDTHGIPEDILQQWIIGLVYGAELTPFGVRGAHNDEVINLEEA